MLADFGGFGVPDGRSPSSPSARPGSSPLDGQIVMDGVCRRCRSCARLPLICSLVGAAERAPPQTHPLENELRLQPNRKMILKTAN